MLGWQMVYQPLCHLHFDSQAIYSITMASQNGISSQDKMPGKQKVTCKGCGKEVQLLRSHLERTKDPCKSLYDMEAMRAESKQKHKHQMAARNRELYHNDPNESPKKRAAAKEYYERKKHGEETQGKYECPICDKAYTILSEMNRHFRDIHAKEDSSFICSICDKKIKYKDNLDTHMREVHGGGKRKNKT